MCFSASTTIISGWSQPEFAKRARMTTREQLEQAIITQEALRATLGDDVVNVTIAALREKLTTLEPEPTTDRQRKQVTVLFADVSGSTAMSETMDAEDVNEIMNALWERLDRTIVEHGGWIDKHMGDAVMALWGVEVTREDDPERAIRAALAIQVELAAFRNDQQADLAMRIGINTGPVLLGEVGTTGEYTAIGDTVNTASRLEHAAPVGGILIAHNTYRHVRGIFDVRPLEPIQVKGKAEPLRVYVVERVRSRAFHLSTRGVEGIETRMIGREPELRHLQDALYTAIKDNRMQVITVTGEAGLGKSRLLYEFEDWLDLIPENLFFFKGRADQQRQQLPYALARDLFAFRFLIQDSDPAAVARQKMEEGFVGLMDEAGVEKSHFIGHLLGFDFSASPYIRGIRDDAKQIRNRAFHYAVQFFAAVTRQAPAVVLLEDVHWGDNGSLDLVNHLSQHSSDCPLLAVALARPSLFERRMSWGEGWQRHTHIELRALSDQDSRRLVEEILRKVPDIPQILQEMIVGRAEGNPFYVEELVKMMIEDGVIVKGDETWQVMANRLAEMRVPPTLTGVLQARLDRLRPAEKRTLQRASVVGRVFWDEAVARLEDAEKDTVSVLPALQGRELIYRREAPAFTGTEEYIFKHAILHDVTYESVLKRARRVYHRQVAEWLIEQSDERVGEYAGLIGEHYERAGAKAEATNWYGRAGKRAQDTYAYDDALTYYNQALALSAKDIETAAPIPLYEGLGETLRLQARYSEAMDAYQAMLAAAQAAGDKIGQARAYTGITLIQDSQGHYRAALASIEQAEQLTRTVDRIDLGGLTIVLYRKGFVLYRLGQAQAALSLAEESLALSSEANDRQEMGQSFNLLGIVYEILGQFEQANLYKEKALALYRESGNRVREAIMLNNLSVTAHLQGDYERDVLLSQEALAISREIGDLNGEIGCLNNRGGAWVGLKEYDAAVVDLQQAIDQAPDDWFMLDETYRALAEAYLGQGKTSAALSVAQKALALSQASSIPDGIGHAWRALGLVAARLSRPVTTGQEKDTTTCDAGDCFAQSVKVFTEFGMERDRAFALWHWARYELAQGDGVKGKTMWQEAQEIFARLNLPLLIGQMDEERENWAGPE